MDQVLSDTLRANLRAAKTAEAKIDALVLAEIAVVDCQFKTGRRVKRQGMIIIGLALLIVVAILCSPEDARTLLTFWRG